MEIQRLKEIIEKQSKEIEELKDESKEYQIGFAQGCYEKDLDWEDKIKAKIEEIKVYKTVLSEPERQFLRFNIEKFEYGIEVLQSLLEKE